MDAIKESTHTALPYEVRELDTDKMFPTTTILGKSKRGGPMVVARVDLHEDAAFIIRACNSHAALVAVLAKILSSHCGGDHDGKGGGTVYIEARRADYEAARAALAKAGGGGEPCSEDLDDADEAGRDAEDVATSPTASMRITRKAGE